MVFVAWQMTDLNLFDRKQFDSINGHVSNQTSVKYGISQGSILCPLLFLIYIKI